MGGIREMHIQERLAPFERTSAISGCWGAGRCERDWLARLRDERGDLLHLEQSCIHPMVRLFERCMICKQVCWRAFRQILENMSSRWWGFGLPSVADALSATSRSTYLVESFEKALLESRAKSYVAFHYRGSSRTLSWYPRYVQYQGTMG